MGAGALRGLCLVETLRFWRILAVRGVRCLATALRVTEYPTDPFTSLTVLRRQNDYSFPHFCVYLWRPSGSQAQLRHR